MQQLTLHAAPRTKQGTGACRRLRRAAQIPAVMYGHGQKRSISLNLREFSTFAHHVRSEHTVVQLVLENEPEALNALIKDVQRNTVTHAIQHIDFLVVDLDQIVKISVPVVLVGEADGVKNHGGVLEPLLREVQVECKAREIPQDVRVDVSALGIHDTITIGALPQLPGVTYLGSPEMPVVTVAPPTVVVEPTPEKEAEAAEAAEPEVIGRGKEEEEGAEGAEEGKPGKEAKSGKEAKPAKEGKDAKADKKEEKKK